MMTELSRAALVKGARSDAMIAMFSALYVVVSILPGIPIPGLPQLTIEIEAAFASVFGIILGPYLGFQTSLLGAIIAWLINPWAPADPFSLPFLINPAFNALVTGLVYEGKWKHGFVIFAAPIIVFPFMPPSQPITVYYYVALLVLWDKIPALFLIIPTIYLNKEDLNLKSKMATALFFILAFIGNQADNALGANIFAAPMVYGGLYGLSIDVTRFLFTVSPFFYPIIRLIQAGIATAIVIPLTIAMVRIGWYTTKKTVA